MLLLYMFVGTHMLIEVDVCPQPVKVNLLTNTCVLVERLSRMLKEHLQ